VELGDRDKTRLQDELKGELGMPGLHLRSAPRAPHSESRRRRRRKIRCTRSYPLPPLSNPPPPSPLFLGFLLLGLHRVEADLSSPTTPFFLASLSPGRTPPSPPCPSPATSGAEIDNVCGTNGASTPARLRFLGGGRRDERGWGGVRSGCWATRRLRYGPNQRRRN
jgi:hypothetical protein